MKTKLTSLILSVLIIHQLNASNIVDNINFKPMTHKKHSFVLKPLTGGDDEGNKGKIMLAAGVGFNLMGTSLVVKYDLSTIYNNSSASSLNGRSAPMFNFSVDYGILKNLTVGAAFGYQTATVTIVDGYYTGNGNYYNYVDTWKRIHLAARVDYDIVHSDNICLYTGLKFGYNIYHVTSTITPIDPTYINRLDVTPSPISFQAHFGFSYYFSGRVGFNTEIGIGYGGPYLAAVGLAVKI